MFAPVRVALRRRGAELCLLALIAAATFVAPTLVQACVSDAECDDLDACSEIDTCEAGVCVSGGGGDGDGDGTCEADDNCPGVANASQDDLDGDSDGDACDEVDRVLNVVVARIKKNINTPIKPTGGPK